MKEQTGFAGKGITRRDFLKLGGFGLAGVSLLGGCGGGGGQGGSDFPTRPITAIVPYSAGGGTDTGARVLQPYVEEALGTSIEIVNRPGGGGWVGWTELVNAQPDGYTIGFIVSPNLMTGYLNPEFNRDNSLEDFAPIANQVIDTRTLAINPADDRFEDINSFIDYAKQNELTVTDPGVGSSDHFGILLINDNHGTNLSAVHTEGSAQSRAAVLGRNADAVAASVGELAQLHNDGELKILAVMGEERSEFLPDVPTFEEAGYPGVYSASLRGVSGPAGIDPEVMEVLVEAFEEGIKSEEHKQELAKQNLQVRFEGPDEYLELLKADEQQARELGQKYIW